MANNGMALYISTIRANMNELGEIVGGEGKNAADYISKTVSIIPTLERSKAKKKIENLEVELTNIDSIEVKPSDERLFEETYQALENLRKLV